MFSICLKGAPILDGLGHASGETARLHSSDVRYEAAPVEEDAVLSKFARAAWATSTT